MPSVADLVEIKQEFARRYLITRSDVISVGVARREHGYALVVTANPGVMNDLPGEFSGLPVLPRQACAA